ncbi:proteasome assembly chaperone family protein [Metallosphaera hakonensis]|uniref:Carboxylate--amine ligase n=1 Tax=Metallosphaera hakonensis JCM 8857 = DSM 7519 TaxID=1293036 RepID=A0A2U9IVN2_9CREN|nr:proteasome assembly chaperone family protein [Metallosphaera hakonensis]AWS00023.1 proteasome assembly chaperone family protein [Metallosphaera hakonensis JCM 8857 = DSM 7519]
MENEFEIEESYVPDLRKPSYLIVGIPDAGLVGEIATEYLITKGLVQEYGQIFSRKYLPPILHVDGGVAKSPLRLYYGKDINLIVLHSWTAMPVNSAYPLAQFIADYAIRYGISSVISITGLPIPNRLDIEKPTAYWIANSKDLASNLNGLDNAQRFDQGYISGPYAPILYETSKKSINNFAIVVESFLDIPDPEASAVALEIVGKFLGFTIDTSALLQEAEEIRSRIKGLMEQTKRELPTYSSGKPMTYA